MLNLNLLVKKFNIFEFDANGLRGSQGARRDAFTVYIYTYIFEDIYIRLYFSVYLT